ncbi:MAG: histidine kinase N-terminal 7TM domain-containing protein [Thermoanaerobaculia bacterium]
MTAILMYHASMLGALLDLVTLLAISRRRAAEGIEVFQLLLVTVILWVVGDANARLAGGPGMRSFWLWVEFLGRPFAPALWLLFTLRYTRVWPVPCGLAAPSRTPRDSVTTLLLAWTNGFHGLVWSLDVVRLPGLSGGSLPGPWFRWVHLPYAWTAVAVGCWLIVSRGTRGVRRPVHPWLFLLVGFPRWPSAWPGCSSKVCASSPASCLSPSVWERCPCSTVFPAAPPSGSPRSPIGASSRALATRSWWSTPRGGSWTSTAPPK